MKISFVVKRIATDVLLFFTEFCLYNIQKNKSGISAHPCIILYIIRCITLFKCGFLFLYRIAIITEDIQNHCPQTCMLTNMCQPQCPIQCCTPPTTNTCQQQACPSACAPGCTTACCSLGSSAHLVKKSTKLTKSYKRWWGQVWKQIARLH